MLVWIILLRDVFSLAVALGEYYHVKSSPCKVNVKQCISFNNSEASDTTIKFAAFKKALIFLTHSLDQGLKHSGRKQIVDFC